MNNKFIWTLAVLLAVGSMGVYGAGIESLPPLNGPVHLTEVVQCLHSRQAV